LPICFCSAIANNRKSPGPNGGGATLPQFSNTLQSFTFLAGAVSALVTKVGVAVAMNQETNRETGKSPRAVGADNALSGVIVNAKK
jgi:hypothetical protein